MTSQEDLRREFTDVREMILKYVRDDSAVLPDLRFIQEFRKDDTRLRAEIAAAQDRLSRIRNARQAHLPARVQFNAAKAQHEESQKALARLYKPFGAAAFAAFQDGEIPRQPEFSDRIALDERIAGLKKQHDALATPSGAGIIGKAKSKARQLALVAKIKAEQFSAAKLDARIGLALIESLREESVRSASTAEALDDLESTRRDIASCKRDFDLAAKGLESTEATLAQAFGVPRIEGETVVAAQIGALETALATTQSRLRTRERDFLDMLVTDASSFADTPIGVPLSRLARLRDDEQAARAREVKSMSGPKNERVGQGGDYVGSIILQVLCVVAAVIAVIAGIVVAVNAENAYPPSSGWPPFLAGLILAFLLLVLSAGLGLAIDIARHTKQTAIDLRHLCFLTAELRGGKSPADRTYG